MASAPKQTTEDVKSNKEVVESVEWTPENEVKFFYALRNRRPVGTERFFEMVVIGETFNELMGKDIPSTVIWNHLDDMYDMDTLNENNSPPPELMEDTDFDLPPDFEELLERKRETMSSEEQSASNDSYSEKAAPSTPTSTSIPRSQSQSSSKSQSLLKPTDSSKFKGIKTYSNESASSDASKKEDKSGKKEEVKDKDSKSDTETPKAKKPSRSSIKSGPSSETSSSASKSTAASTQKKRQRN